MEDFLPKYLSKIQRDEPPIAEELGQWVELKHWEPKSKVWEHASLLDSDKLEKMLGEDLQRPWVSERELQTKSNADKAKLILSFESSSFVAILDEDRRFKKLIDRQPIIEEAIRSVLE
jgi:hypothetical protein